MVIRGEVWLATLDPTVGREIHKTRPCLIISPPDLHDRLRTLIVAPMTTANRPAGFRVPIRFKGRDGLVLLDQIRTVDRSHLVKRLGTAPASVVEVTLATLRELFEP